MSAEEDVCAARKRTTTAIRFPDSLHKQLKDAAAERGVSINFLTVKACEDFVARLIPAEKVKWTK